MAEPRTRLLYSEIVIATRSALDRTKGIPELLIIDREIGRPYWNDPLVFNSQAWSRKLELPWVVEHIGAIEGQSILDVGSGVSALPIYFKRRGADVTSVDLDVPRGLPDGRVSRVQSAMPKLPFRDASFNVVVCVSVLEHVNADMAECFAEICRLARQRVILTFDVALNPICPYGLSSIELKAFAKMLRTRLVLPRDPLVSPAAELGIWANRLGVCMLCLDRPENGWPSLPIGPAQRLTIRLYRSAQAYIFIQQQLRTKVRGLIARRQRIQ